ncbi:uncharacterized protein LOC141604895 [Silene latifolia]|uniref:uncharacterized protein LOC141604895 n=1 Tax=Silene latifolia TaxID=37657 RepID=UPI003D776DEC
MAQYRQYNNDHYLYTNGGGGANGGGASTSGGGGGGEHVAIGVRGGPHHYYKKSHHHHHYRRLRNKRISIATAITFVCCVVAAFSLGFLYFSTYDHHSGSDTDNVQDDAFKDDFLKNVTRFSSTKVKFGHGSTTHGRDSRYWDGDDRRRDEDYNEDEHKSSSHKEDGAGKGHASILVKSSVKKPSDNMGKGSDHHGLYNEAGRNELQMYEKKYEASLKNTSKSGAQTEGLVLDSDEVKLVLENEETVTDDEYDDGIDDRIDDAIDSHDARIDDPKSHSGDHEADVGKGRILVDQRSSHDSSKSNSDDTGRKTRAKKRRKHHSSSSCEMKLLNSTTQLVEPLESRKFVRFSLSYTQKEEKPDGVDQWEPRFSGHQSLREREDSFIARDQTINCGFVKGSKEYSGTGFDLVEDDYRYISKCHIAVISCIFGNSDRLRSPFTKAVSRLSRKNVCFVMFMDETTLETLTAEGQMPDRMGYIGLWKVVVVKNLPFTDMRRVGKIPKLLSHRLFPSARYSIWLDSKLRLQQDPLLLLENFLWRKGYEYAISNHYDRHCVWKEVERNKKLNKFNHTMIDQQFQFYQADGLKRFNASDPNKMLPSNVPEGSLIIRAHTPMSNLFSCLWFNEVDRFTPRDQLSFAFTYQKLRKKNPSKPFYLHMFKDCERRQIAKLFRHRAIDKRNSAQVANE